MYCEHGLKLVQDAKRTQTLQHLPPYQPELVRSATREVRELDQHATTLLASFQDRSDPSAEPALACALLVDHLSMRRNKRCLLAYHRTRVDKIESLCWSGQSLVEEQRPSGTGDGTEPALATTRTTHAPSPEEEEYAAQYADLVAAWKGKWTDIDLGGSLEPPKELFIDVRVLKDAGEIQTEYGSINLKKNSQFYVRHSDVERLISQGYLQRLD